MSVIEWDHVPITSNNEHFLFITEGSVTISSTGLFADDLWFFVVENDFRKLKLWVFWLKELVLFTELMNCVVETLGSRGERSFLFFYSVSCINFWKKSFLSSQKLPISLLLHYSHFMLRKICEEILIRVRGWLYFFLMALMRPWKRHLSLADFAIEVRFDYRFSPSMKRRLRRMHYWLFFHRRLNTCNTQFKLLLFLNLFLRFMENYGRRSLWLRL